MTLPIIFLLYYAIGMTFTCYVAANNFFLTYTDFFICVAVFTIGWPILLPWCVFLTLKNYLEDDSFRKKGDK